MIIGIVIIIVNSSIAIISGLNWWSVFGIVCGALLVGVALGENR